MRIKSVDVNYKLHVITSTKLKYIECHTRLYKLYAHTLSLDAFMMASSFVVIDLSLSLSHPRPPTSMRFSTEIVK